MASRLFQFRYSNERDLQDIQAKITIGASGAPTLTLAKGINSMVRNSAGNYTINLKDNANVLMKVDVDSISGASAPAAPRMNVVSEQVNSATAPSLIIQMRDASGVAADPASGEVLLVHIQVRLAST